MAKGKIVVVTGANKGIGKEIVRKLARDPIIKGDNGGVIILTARNVELGNAAKQEIEQSNDGHEYSVPIRVLELDISDTKSIDSFVDRIHKDFGTIDILINNAGFAFKQAATEPFGQQATVTLGINFYGTVELTEKLKSSINKGGRIVFVSSSAGLLSNLSQGPNSKRNHFLTARNLDELKRLVQQFETVAQEGENKAYEEGFSKSTYGISKAAVTTYARILSEELKEKENIAKVEAKDRILVNACCPGWCKTDMAGHDRPPRTAAQGAETPVFLALLGEDGETGKFWSDNRIKDF